jgi:hypothetical protein
MALTRPQANCVVHGFDHVVKVIEDAATRLAGISAGAGGIRGRIISRYAATMNALASAMDLDLANENDPLAPAVEA